MIKQRKNRQFDGIKVQRFWTGNWINFCFEENSMSSHAHTNNPQRNTKVCVCVSIFTAWSLLSQQPHLCLQGLRRTNVGRFLLWFACMCVRALMGFVLVNGSIWSSLAYWTCGWGGYVQANDGVLKSMTVTNCCLSCFLLRILSILGSVQRFASVQILSVWSRMNSADRMWKLIQ